MTHLSKIGLEQATDYDAGMQLRVNTSTPEEMCRLERGEFGDITSALAALIQINGPVALDKLQAIAVHVAVGLERLDQSDSDSFDQGGK